MQITRFDFQEFVDNNTDVGENEYDITCVNQGISSRSNRAKRNVNFHDTGNYEDVDKDLDSIELKILNLQGKNDSDTYLEWEKKVDRIFYYHNYSKQKKVKLMVIEFTEYALI